MCIRDRYWVIDEEAAQVVRRIFDMTLEGFGTEQSATQFEKEGILTPQAYWIQKGIGRPGRSKICLLYTSDDLIPEFQLSL